MHVSRCKGLLAGLALLLCLSGGARAAVRTDPDEAPAATGAPVPRRGAASKLASAPAAPAPSSEHTSEPRVQAEALPGQPWLAKREQPVRKAGPAAVSYRGPGPGPVGRKVSIADLRPTKDHAYRRDFYYQIPDQPRATVLLIHGCASGAYNYWPQSDACPGCRGLPEQMSHVVQALQRGYAVVSVNSLNFSSGCWSWWDDCYDVKDLMKDWLKQNGLRDLPLYSIGVSSGAAFALKLPRFLQFDGVHSEALAVTIDSWGLEKMKGKPYPPTVFASMLRDKDMALKISAAWKELHSMDSPVEVVGVHPRQVYPTYFSDRFASKISPVLSRKITEGLRAIKMIDGAGNVLEDPRYTNRPWLSQLQAKVPELRKASITMDGSKALPEWPENEDVVTRGVWSLLNLAYANHEIVSDYVTAAFLWFESLAQANLFTLVAQHTYGLPPARRRGTLEQADEEADASSHLAAALAGTEVLAEGKLEAAAAKAAKAAGRLVDAPVHAAELVDMRRWQLPGSSSGGASQQAEQGQAQADQRPYGPLDEQLLREAAELEAELGIDGAPLLDAATLQAAGAAPRRSPGARRDAAPQWEVVPTSPEGSLIGAPLVGAAVVLLLAALVAALRCRRRAEGQVGGLLAGTVQAVHPAAHQVSGLCSGRAQNAGPRRVECYSPGSSRLSIIPGVKERFDLTEVVEASGSPYSARRRIKTAFSESPHKSPHKRSGSGF
ncbi:hypothetical protein ABPG75_011167 [Micractinium tetrahymenae]